MSVGRSPAVFCARREFHGSIVAGFFTDRKVVASGADIFSLTYRSNAPSMHSLASASTVAIAAGSTTSFMGASKTLAQDHIVMAVRLRPPALLRSSVINAARSVAGAAAAT